MPLFLRSRVIHAHIDPALFQFINHLIKSLGTDLWSNRAINPGNIIIALIGRSMVIICSNRILF